MSAASIAAEVEGVGGSACQCSDHTPQTESNWSAWLHGCSFWEERSLFWKWKRNPVATCEALVNSMPKRVKVVLENNGGHKILTLWAQLGHFHLGVYSLLWPAV